MDAASSPPYLPGRLPDHAHPLARFLPPAPAGVVAAWLEEHAPPGAWVLDPFGALPELPIEAARAGYRVLVAANNPLARFLIEIAASPIEPGEFQAAVAELAAARKGDQRLEPLLQSLYETPCAGCGRDVPAQAFAWARGAGAPFARIYRCPHCGDEGERPVTPLDEERAARYAAGGLHQAWALERVTPVGDPDRRHAQEALSVYLPRARYALFTLISKLDGLMLPDERRRALHALLVSACDRGNSLWQHPSGRPRPRQLSASPEFYEHNIWMALTEAIPAWSLADSPVPLAYWPDPAPESGGISLYRGRLRDLAPGLEQLKPNAVVTALPRPSQAYWSLSAIWSAWLWGHESLGPFKSVLRRRRYDWSWHATALHAAFGHLRGAVPAGRPALAISPEAEPGLLAAAAVAAGGAGFSLTGIALRAEASQAQVTFHRSSSPTQRVVEAPEAGVREAVRRFLLAQGEPVAYPYVHAAALEHLAAGGQFTAGGPSPGEALTEAQNLIERALTGRAFIRYGGSQHSLEVGQWWLADSAGAAPPLSDRVEEELAAYLQAHPVSDRVAVDAALCRAFPGLHTPEAALVGACLDSYGELTDETSDQWRLRKAELPEARAADRQAVRELLRRLGEELSFQVTVEETVRWSGADGAPQYEFFVLTSAVIGQILLESGVPPERGVVLLPGGRANLVLHKLNADPRLAVAVERGWRFLKFRHLRRLAESPLLRPDTLDDQLALDPLTYSRPQIPLL